jgi:hypothetical protein
MGIGERQSAMKARQAKHPGPIARVVSAETRDEIQRRALIAAQLTIWTPEHVAEHYHIPLSRLTVWIDAGMPLGPLSKVFTFNV